MNIQQGSIVWVAIADPAGKNPKCRPGVVVTPTHEIVADQTIVIVAATSTFKKPLPQNVVPIPWYRGGHPVTGLFRETVAVCDWLVEVFQSDVVRIGGVCPPTTLSQILSRLPTGH